MRMGSNNEGILIIDNFEHFPYQFPLSFKEWRKPVSFSGGYRFPERYF
jgi:hypothetical protein